MLKIYKILFSLLCITYLSACTPVNGYVEPQSTATIRGNWQRTSLAEWKSTQVLFIDGKSIGSQWSYESKIKILPGNHNVIVNATFNAGYGSGPYSSIVEIPVDVKPQQNYVVKTQPKGAQMQAWIEDGRGNKVSPVQIKDYQLVANY